VALIIEETSKVTAKGQTTVPKAVRQALGIRSGDQIAYRLDESGAVCLVRHEAQAEDSAMDAFLVFLSNDIKERPEGVASMSDETANRLRALTAGVDVDLEGDFAASAAL
jgi:antitoxin PrlF